MTERGLFEFGEFRLDTGQRVLLRGGEAMVIPPKAMDTLVVLVQRRGTIVSRDELLAAVWPNVFVEENNLSQYISLLRRTLGESTGAPRLIQTIARRGYRFTASAVTVIEEKGDVLETDEYWEEVAMRPVALTWRARVAAWRKALRRPRTAGMVAGGVAVLVLLGVWALRREAISPVSAAQRPVTLAVLPCAVTGDDNTDSAWGLAVADDLGWQLSRRTEQLRVRPLESLFHLDNKATPMAAGRALEADYVAVCALTLRGDDAAEKLRIVRVSDGSEIWAKTLNGAWSQWMTIEERSAAALFKAMTGRPLAAKGGSAGGHLTKDFAAYVKYVEGMRAFDERTSVGTYQSIDALQQAVTLDPVFARGHAALAAAYACDFTLWPKAEATARRALALAPGLAEAHAALGLEKMLWRRDYEGAAQELRAAISADPDLAVAHLWYADNFATKGRTPEGMTEVRTAYALSPLSVPVMQGLAQMEYFSDQYGEAHAQAERTLAINPAYIQAHLLLIDIDMQRRDYDGVVAEFRKVQELGGNSSIYSVPEADRLAAIYKTGGIAGFWRARIADLQARKVGLYEIAKAWMYVGEPQMALRELKLIPMTPVPTRGLVLYAGAEPVFAPLHGHPAFEASLQ